MRTSYFFPGEEVFHDLNERSLVPEFWQVAASEFRVQIFGRSENIFFVICCFCVMRLRGCVCHMLKCGAGVGLAAKNINPPFIFCYVTRYVTLMFGLSLKQAPL